MSPRSLILTTAALIVSPQAFAQKTTENAVTSAEDAFGTSVGTETIGIYSEFDTRGFNPSKTGNARLDGIYFDPVGFLSPKIRAGSAVRVGIAAVDYPFPAPTGIIDSKLRSAGDRLIISPSLTSSIYGGFVQDVDAQIPLVAGHLGVALGLAHSTPRGVDGSGQENYIAAIKPVIRFSGIEFSPFVAKIWTRRYRARALAVTSGPIVPDIPETGTFLGQDWADGGYDTTTIGATFKAQLGSGFSVRSGAFRAQNRRLRNVAELYVINPANSNSTHIVITDPDSVNWSKSWETQLGWSKTVGNLAHRLILGVRGRHRYAETGGSDRQIYRGVIPYGIRDVRPEPAFAFTPVNVGTVRQTSFMAGYLGKIKGKGQINLGLQKTRYRAIQATGAGGQTSASASPWLYNASVEIDLSPAVALFGGTVKGLEDSGTAADSAINRNEQLNATLSTQYDGGIRLRLGKSQLVASAFQIEKPFFGFDTANRFSVVGTVRHRGAELSYSGKIGPHLQLLVGGLLMSPRVSGSAVDAGLVGKRPTGVPSSQLRIDANYRTPILGNLTPTFSFVRIGKRASSSAPFASLGNQQVILPVFNSLDLGLRNNYKIAKTPMSIRLVVSNVLDEASWKIVAANTLQPEDRRRMNLSFSADF